MAQGITIRLLVEGFLGSSLAWVRIFYRKRPTYTFLVESALRELSEVSIVRSFGKECEVLSSVDMSPKHQDTISGRTTTSETRERLDNDFVTRGVVELVHVELPLQ